MTNSRCYINFFLLFDGRFSTLSNDSRYFICRLLFDGFPLKQTRKAIRLKNRDFGGGMGENKRNHSARGLIERPRGDHTNPGYGRPGCEYLGLRIRSTVCITRTYAIRSHMRTRVVLVNK